MSATKKFVESHRSTISGMETELGAINPKYKWDKALQEHNQKVAQLAPTSRRPNTWRQKATPISTAT